MANQKSLTEIKMSHFKIGDGKVIYPATITKRIFARLIDLFFASILPAILTISFFFNVNDNTFINAYNNQMMWQLGVGFASYLTFFILIPLLNKKNLGQSLGKKFLKISPLYLEDKNNYISFLIRESFMGMLLTLPYFFYLIIGFDPLISASIYNTIYSNTTDHSGLVNATGSIDFLVNIWGDGNGFELNGVNYKIENWQVGVGILGLVITYLFYISVIIVWISAGSNSQKRGLHDTLAKSAIVDLNTVTNESDAIERYNKLLGIYNLNNQAESELNQNISDNNETPIELDSLNEVENDLKDDDNKINENSEQKFSYEYRKEK